MPRADDYAILVGIQDYPGAQVAALSGPCHDVEYFQRWLVDPLGGDVPPQNIFPLLTPVPRPAAFDAAKYPPTQQEFNDTFRAIVFDANGPKRRPNGRLYLYFSGHGFSDFRDQAAQAAIYCGNIQPGQSFNICGTLYGGWAARAAAFGEIVLVMDCCRDEELSKTVLPPPFDDIHDAALAKKVRLFEIYAVPYGQQAQERFFSDVGRQHGVLTYALLTALYAAPLEPVKGKGLGRTAHALKSFIEGAWSDVAGADGPEPPEFTLPRSGDIILSTSQPRSFPRQVRFTPKIAGQATLAVLNDAGATTLTVGLDSTAGVATITANGQAPITKPFDGEHLILEVKPEVYELRLDIAGAPSRTAFLRMVSDKDVDV